METCLLNSWLITDTRTHARTHARTLAHIRHLRERQKCVCVCVCVFSDANPLHYYTRFGFRARRIDGVSVIYFRITHRLGRPHYVWEEYLHSVVGS